MPSNPYSRAAAVVGAALGLCAAVACGSTPTGLPLDSGLLDDRAAGDATRRPGDASRGDGGGMVDAGPNADAERPFDAATGDVTDAGGERDAVADTSALHDAASEASAESDAGRDSAPADATGQMDATQDASADSGGADTSVGQDAKGPPPATCMSSAMCSAGKLCLGGACLPPTLLLLAGSPSGILGGALEVGGAWATTPLGDGTTFGTSLAVDSGGRGVGVYTSTTGGAVSSTIWSSGAWSAASGVGAGAAAREQPFIDATGSATAQLIYQDPSYHYWSLGFGTSWSSPEAVGTAGNQNYGPVPATIATVGANATAAFVDGEGPGVNDLAASDRVGGAWQPQADLTPPVSFTIAPTIVPLSAGPDAMIVFVEQDDQIMFTTRSAGTWSVTAAIASALTPDRVAVAPLPEGGAIAAFRGTDGNLYWSTYSAGAWSPVTPFSTPNVAVDVPPAVTHGIGGDIAEIAYVSGGAVYQARLSAASWSAPVLVGGTGVVGVGLAAAP